MPPAADDTELVRAGTLIPSLHPRETIGRAPLDEAVAVGSGLELGPLLGEGGMGRVHRATQRALGREVAVKTLRPALRSPQTERLLLQEAWATGALEHPNIVPVYTITHDPQDGPRIVLKRIDGRPWDALLADAGAVARDFDAPDLLAWNLSVLEQVCRAVHFAHSRGILHRDLKPSNVMIGALGEVYLVDWGLAVSLEPAHAGRIPLAAAQRRMAGTPHYMAPEMLAGDGAALSAQTDLYLLGGVLYEILTGAAPHAVSDRTDEVLAAIPEFIPLFPDDVPPILEQLCAAALAPAPADRPDSALAFARQLQTFQQQRGAVRLVEEAAQGLARLRGLLAAEAPADPLAVYRELGACRFGFQQALRVWPGHRPAARGLHAAVSAVVSFELARGEIGAAEALLRELDAPPAALLETVASQKAAAEAAAEAARRLQEDIDPRLGQRTRIFVGVVVGASWSALPALVWALAPEVLSNAGVLWVTGVIVLSLVALVLWGWDSLTRTAFNRRILGALLLAPICQLLLSGWALVAAIPVEVVLTFSLLLWAADAALVAMTVDRRIAPSAAGYLAAFGVCAAWPDGVLLAVAAGNLCLLLNVLGGWAWPARQELLRR